MPFSTHVIVPDVIVVLLQPVVQHAHTHPSARDVELVVDVDHVQVDGGEVGPAAGVKLETGINLVEFGKKSVFFFDFFFFF